MFKSILEYQRIEGEIIALETDLAKSGDREKAAQIQQSLKNQHSRLIVLETNAKKVNEAYTKAISKYEEYSKKLEELEKQITVVEADKVELYEKAYKDFAAVANALEKDITKLHNEIQSISREYEEIIKKSKSDREKFDKYKTSYSKQKATIEPQIEEAKKKLVEIQKEIDAKLFAKYSQKREGRIFPVFVRLNVNKCGGCRVELSATKLGEMKKNEFGIIECENCGRYIYAE